MSLSSYLNRYYGELSRSYKLFISHSWDHKDEYEGVVNLLKLDPTFHWEDLSIPEENPLAVRLHLPKSYRYLVRQIDERISQSDCLIVLAGMYAAHRGWIQSEIEAAQEFRKPIIAVEPRGNERFPDAVMHAANERVGWNRASIIASIRKHVGRGPLLPPPPGYLSR